MRYSRYRIDPRLATILGELGGSPLGQSLADRLGDLAGHPATRPSGPSGEELLLALAPHRWVLDRASGGGIPLTDAGCLKPADVKPLAAVLPTMDDWIFPINREVNAQPVLGFRRHLQAVGLLRKYKGTLLLTRAALACRRDPGALWAHLTEYLIPTKPSFDQTAAVLALLHFATAPGGRVDTEAISQAMIELGWAHAGGKPVTTFDVQWVVNDVWDAIGNVGANVGKGVLDRTPGPAAIALIRDALLTERSDQGA